MRSATGSPVNTPKFRFRADPRPVSERGRAGRHRGLCATPTAALAIAFAAALLLSATGARASTDRFDFDVLFDDRSIGSHRFEIVRDGAAEQVLSVASFDIKALLVFRFSYRHEAREAWQDGCLRTLSSTTDDNGKRFDVSIEPAATGLTVIRRAPMPETQHLPDGCAATFAYWDLARLQRGDALINAQNGARVPIRLKREGTETIGSELADRYRLEPDGMDPMTLWYRRDDGRWLGLEVRQPVGVLRYQPSEASAAGG